MSADRVDDDSPFADRHIDLDVGEFGGAMTDAEFYERTSTPPVLPHGHLRHRLCRTHEALRLEDGQVWG